MAALGKIINSPKISEHAHGHAQNRFAVIPLSARLGALENFTGRGVTMAFLDSGFYPHPDLIEPRNRVVAFKDIAGEGASFEPRQSPQSWQWHGTQTSVVAAGNGRLSDGLYRGLAPDARLVLVEASERGRITEENLAGGIEWVVKNRERYDIRVLNISLGGDYSRTPFSRDAGGIWRLEMEPPPRGRYRYKLVVDGGHWVDDPSNGLKEPDEFGGFNSLVNVG